MGINYNIFALVSAGTKVSIEAKGYFTDAEKLLLRSQAAIEAIEIISPDVQEFTKEDSLVNSCEFTVGLKFRSSSFIETFGTRISKLTITQEDSSDQIPRSKPIPPPIRTALTS